MIENFHFIFTFHKWNHCFLPFGFRNHGPSGLNGTFFFVTIDVGFGWCVFENDWSDLQWKWVWYCFWYPKHDSCWKLLWFCENFYKYLFELYFESFDFFQTLTSISSHFDFCFEHFYSQLCEKLLMILFENDFVIHLKTSFVVTFVVIVLLLKILTFLPLTLFWAFRFDSSFFKEYFSTLFLESWSFTSGSFSTSSKDVSTYFDLSVNKDFVLSSIDDWIPFTTQTPVLKHFFFRVWLLTLLTLKSFLSLI